MMNNPDLGRRLMERILLGRYREDDRLVLDDAILEGAIRGERRLSRGEIDDLMDSPLTLLRFRHLSRVLHQSARALGGWMGSQGLMLAAESDAELFSIATSDGQWTLYFQPGRGGRVHLILKYTGSRDLPARLVAEGQGVAVRDAGGAVLLRGVLDEDGELEAPWPLESAPRAHFRATGGRFSVTPGPA